MSAVAIDLFAGAGGLSEGARMAGVRVAWAANHWQEAVRWHWRNHPNTTHACQDLHQADFRDAPAHDILLSAPACQGHSKARGTDKPHHDKMRATAWAVVTCAEVHRPPVVVVENVPELLGWVLYPAWRAGMEALGYALSPVVIDAADHGVPQNRVRLFIVCTRSRNPIKLRLPHREHVPVSQVLDFEAGRWSRVADKVPATRARWACGRAALGERFVMPYNSSGSGLTGRCIGRPLGAITTVARWALVKGDLMRMMSVREGQKVMGFPPGYQFPTAAKLAWHLMGNAVVPVVGCDVLEAVQAAV